MPSGAATLCTVEAPAGRCRYVGVTLGASDIYRHRATCPGGIHPMQSRVRRNHQPEATLKIRPANRGSSGLPPIDAAGNAATIRIARPFTGRYSVLGATARQIG